MQSPRRRRPSGRILREPPNSRHATAFLTSVRGIGIGRGQAGRGSGTAFMGRRWKHLRRRTVKAKDGWGDGPRKALVNVGPAGELEHGGLLGRRERALAAAASALRIGLHPDDAQVRVADRDRRVGALDSTHGKRRRVSQANGRGTVTEERSTLGRGRTLPERLLPWKIEYTPTSVTRVPGTARLARLLKRNAPTTQALGMSTGRRGRA